MSGIHNSFFKVGIGNEISFLHIITAELLVYFNIIPILIKCA